MYEIPLFSASKYLNIRRRYADLATLVGIHPSRQIPKCKQASKTSTISSEHLQLPYAEFYSRLAKRRKPQ